jgi:hypothetical protein
LERARSDWGRGGRATLSPAVHAGTEPCSGVLTIDFVILMSLLEVFPS